MIISELKIQSTDFRNASRSVTKKKCFQDLLRKQVGDRSVCEYPFAVAGINITFMLIQMLGLESGTANITYCIDIPFGACLYIH